MSTSSPPPTDAVMLHDTWGLVRILAYWDRWAAVVAPVGARPDHPGLPCFLKNLRPTIAHEEESDEHD